MLFAAREVPVETLGVSSFDMIFAHSVTLLKESWLQDEIAESNLIDYISDFKERLHKAIYCAHDNLKISDHKSGTRSLVGSQVFDLLPVPGSPLKGIFQGPYKVVKRLNDLD